MSTIPSAVLDEATDMVLSTGVRVFQGARMADTELGHVEELLRFSHLPCGSHVLDIGCGVGEVANLMSMLDPSLKFTLINNHPYQLSHCPPDFPQFLCDMHDIPIGGDQFDAAMFCYSLCHADTQKALTEAARLVKKGGTLLVYDYERLDGDNHLFSQVLYSTAIPRWDMVATAASCGWTVENWVNPDVDDYLFRSAFQNDVAYDQIFNDLKVCLWRATRL